MKTRILLDSGAPTLYHKYARGAGTAAVKSGMMGSHLKDRKHDNFDWLDNPDYLAYRERYAQYILQHKDKIEVYTNLDIVNNPHATWENQQYFESLGLSPLPVWHFGSDISWLKHYLRKGYDHIGIGGLVPNPYTTLRPALDEIWSQYLTDANGFPLVKVHGFAATSIPLMCRYPWHSVDSASWIKYAAFGGIMIPAAIRGVAKYTERPYKISVSGKSPLQKKKDMHITNIGSPALEKYLLDYIASQGFVLGLSEFDGDKEIVIEPGLVNRPEIRCQFNALYYMGLRDELPPWPWPFKATKGLSLW